MQPITAVVLLTLFSVVVASRPHHLWGEDDDVRDFYYREVGRHVLETNIHFVEHVVVARTAGVEFQGAPFTDGHKRDQVIVIQQANQTFTKRIFKDELRRIEKILQRFCQATSERITLSGNETVLHDLGQLPWPQYDQLLHYNASSPAQKMRLGYRYFREAFRELTTQPKDILDVKSPVVRNAILRLGKYWLESDRRLLEQGIKFGSFACTDKDELVFTVRLPYSGMHYVTDRTHTGSVFEVFDYGRFVNDKTAFMRMKIEPYWQGTFHRPTHVIDLDQCDKRCVSIDCLERRRYIQTRAELVWTCPSSASRTPARTSCRHDYPRGCDVEVNSFMGDFIDIRKTVHGYIVATTLTNFTVIDAMTRNATMHLMPESGIIDVENLPPTHVLVVGEYVLQGHSVEPQFKVKDVKASPMAFDEAVLNAENVKVLPSTWNSFDYFIGVPGVSRDMTKKWQDEEWQNAKWAEMIKRPGYVTIG